MGMEHHQGPRRRRVGAQDPSQRLQQSQRLSHEAGRLVQALQRPGRLHEEGCSKGDVLEIALREMARENGADAVVDEMKAAAALKE
jgi:hypothetical protein